MARPIYQQRRLDVFDGYYPGTIKQVTGTLATNVPVTVWTPASTAKFNLKGGYIQGTVTVDLAGGAAGYIVALIEETAVTVVAQIGVLTAAAVKAGSQIPGGQATAAALAPGATTPFAVPTTGFTFTYPVGWKASTAGKKLQIAVLDTAGAIVTIGATGKIVVSGLVWGDEV